jgi:hypothetical protein
MRTEQAPGAMPSDEAILQWLADQVGLAIVRADAGPEAQGDVAMASAAITRLRELIAALEQIETPETCTGKSPCQRAAIAHAVLRTALLRANAN